MGSGSVKQKKKEVVECENEEDSFDFIENKEKIQAVLLCDNEELAQHDDLLVQACFCDLPQAPASIYKYEKSVASKSHIILNN